MPTWAWNVAKAPRPSVPALALALLVASAVSCAWNVIVPNAHERALAAAVDAKVRAVAHATTLVRVANAVATARVGAVAVRTWAQREAAWAPEPSFAVGAEVDAGNARLVTGRTAVRPLGIPDERRAASASAVATCATAVAHDAAAGWA